MKNRIEFILFKFFVKLTHWLGRKKSLRLAEILGKFFYNYIPIRKDVVLKNLSLAFPEKSAAEIDRLAGLNYVHFLKTFFDVFLMDKFDEERLMTNINVVGLELLREEYNKGNGVIILTGHFGNWEVGAVATGIASGVSINVLTKQQRNPYVTEWMDNLRQKFGNRVSNLGTGVRSLFKTLKEGGMIGIVGDQRGPKESERIAIFGQPTAFYNGFASIIAKSASPVVVAIMSRQPDDSYVLEFQKMEYSTEGENPVLNIVQQYATILEKYIRKYPEQWFWMHNIWKY